MFSEWTTWTEQRKESSQHVTLSTCLKKHLRYLKKLIKCQYYIFTNSWLRVVTLKMLKYKNFSHNKMITHDSPLSHSRVLMSLLLLKFWSKYKFNDPKHSNFSLHNELSMLPITKRLQ